MKIKTLMCLVSLFIVNACSSGNSDEHESNFSELLDNYYESTLKLNPINATFAGDPRYNDKFPNTLSDEYQNEAKAIFTSYLSQLADFNRESFNEEDKMSYDVLKWELEIALEALDFDFDLTPIDQFWTIQLIIGQLASGESAQPFITKDDYTNWLKRMSAYLIWCESAIDKMNEGIAKNYVLPKALVLKIIPQMESLDHGPVENHLFFGPIRKIPSSFTEDEKKTITNLYRVVIEEKVIPTYKKLHDYFKSVYLKAARESSGISALDRGLDIYKHKIKRYTTTDMSADEIFSMGKAEVERIRNEMESIKNQVGFKGDLKSFFNHLRNKKELMPFKKADEVITNFKKIHETMKPSIISMFKLMPKTQFEIRRTEVFREKSASAEYSQGSLDGTRPGIFYVPIPDVSKYNTLSDESLFLHEAIPGHHFQISLQQENVNLPQFRKTLYYSAYGEGWALYTESLGKELGLYTDPYQYFGMLGAEMHRAIRLVVDAGIHTKGWTREEAIKYSLANEAESEASIISEIERYMAEPAQATSYKIGQIKIRELRAKAEKELADKFDIRSFHEKVLESGNIPLQLLENKINQWIKSQ